MEESVIVKAIIPYRFLHFTHSADAPFLGVMSEIAESLNIDLVLQGGTHLGYIRHGGIIYPGSSAQDLVEVTFEGTKFKVPYNSIEVLDARYKD